MIPARYTYLLVEVCCLAIPFLASFHPKLNFHKQWRYFFPPCVAVAFLFAFWDIWFTHIGIWRFNPNYVIGSYLFGLPLEEYLFFLIIPYCSIFTYHSISSFFRFGKYLKASAVFSICLLVFLATLGVLNLHRLYTSVTFITLAIVLAVLQARPARFLPAFYVTFALILIPFFVSNGILTGSFIDEPVVMYNNSHNLGLRMFTIPFEDTFYGMLLILLNVAGYEYVKKPRI